MDIKEITLYQIKFDNYLPYIKKNTFKLDKNDKIEFGKNGFVSITLVDACVSGHNGDYYDDHEGGYKTFKQAQKHMIKKSKENAKKELEYIKALKEKVN